jgi:hypothetical protein
VRAEEPVFIEDPNRRGAPMKRRELMQTMGLGVLTTQLSVAGARKVHAQVGHCRVVVFGSDALRFDLAWRMWREGAPGLSVLERPICSLSGGGQSVTQPGWTDIWTGLPAAYHGFVKNGDRAVLPDGIHIMGKVMDDFVDEDVYAVWIVGKGMGLLDGEDPRSPHHPVYRRIVEQDRPGVYLGDENREDLEVFQAAREALAEAARHRNFCCFVHFHNPDTTGHLTRDAGAFARAALGVDGYIRRLMGTLPDGVDVIYCSDHGFNFTALGEVEDSHGFAPRGMVATSFPTGRYRNVTRPTVGRWIYERAGGDPDHCEIQGRAYAMYGA